MSVLLTNGVVQFFLVLLAIVGLVSTLWCLFADSLGGWQKSFAIIPGLVLFLAVWGFFWGQTHVVIPPNRYVLIVDQKTGTPILPLRGAGITEVPLWTWSQFGYPAQRDYQWCPTFTPSSKNGASLTTVVCFTTNAHDIDWARQFASFNGDENVVMAGWQNAVQQNVASSIALYDPRELTNRRADVENEIFRQTAKWFEDHGVTVTMVGLKDWRFSSDEINKAYDQAQLSQTQIDVANAEKQAAQVQQETALIRAQTQVKVVTTLAEGQRAACIKANMVSETGCIEYLQLVWLSQSGANPNVVVITGGENTAPVIALPPTTK